MRLTLALVALTLTACEAARAGSGSPTEGDGWVEKDCSYDPERREFTANVGDSFPPPIVQVWMTTSAVYTKPAEQVTIDPDGLLTADASTSDPTTTECTVYVWK